MLGSAVLHIGQDGFFAAEFTPYSKAVDDSNERPNHVDWEKLKTKVKSAASDPDRYSLVIVEGHTVLNDPELVEMCQTVIYLHLEADESCARRVGRRARGIEESNAIRKYFHEFVWPAHEKYVLPHLDALASREENRNPELRLVSASPTQAVVSAHVLGIVCRRAALDPAKELTLTDYRTWRALSHREP